MLSTCTCGKKLVFGSDPNEEQLCDRCGQRVVSPLAGEEKAPVGTPAPKRGGGSSMPKPKDLPHRFAASPMSSRLFRKTPRKESSLSGKLGCAAIVLVVLGVPLGIDYYRDPYGQMKCGHTGKEALFGAIPLHSCAGMRALRYLDLVRREMSAREAEGKGTVGTVEALGITEPADTPYTYKLTSAGYLAIPKDDAPVDLPYYFVSDDGSVYMAKDYEPNTNDTKTGTFADQ